MEISELDKELIRLDVRHAPHSERKPLYLRRNCVEISPDQEIWRIFKAPFILADLKNNKLSMPEISVEGIGKQEEASGENPFLNHEFRMEDGYPVYLAFLRDYYGLCWSTEDIHRKWAWDAFAETSDGILVKSTVGKFMNELMNLNNRFYMLTYFCGRVQYESESSLANWKANATYHDFIGTQGFESLKSLLRLPDTYLHEKEVRFVYRCPENNVDFPDVTINRCGSFRVCKQEFNWECVIDEVHLDSRIPLSKREKYAQELQVAGVTCPIITI